MSKADNKAPSKTDQATDLLYRRMVVKAGTNTLTGGTDHLDMGVMDTLAAQIADLHQQEAQVILVTSGAVAAGRQALGATKDRKDIPFRQVLASIGQSRLMQAYQQLFQQRGITVAQALVTRGDLTDRLGYLNVRNTLLALLELGAVPIVNENDVVAVEELAGEFFGDNDNLSALVANLVDADLLVMLTDTDGLYTSDPHKDPDARLIPRVERIDAVLIASAGTSWNSRGTGGMVTKLEAAKLATSSGVTVVIANGREQDVLLKLARGQPLGTLFPPTASKMESRARWMLSGLSSRGRITVDDGASLALRQKNRSLLPAGVLEVDGPFQRGDIVDIVDQQGQSIACGIANYSSREVERIKGAPSSRIQGILGYRYGDEVVHRNNLVLL